MLGLERATKCIVDRGDRDMSPCHVDGCTAWDAMQPPTQISIHNPTTDVTYRQTDTCAPAAPEGLRARLPTVGTRKEPLGTAAA